MGQIIAIEDLVNQIYFIRGVKVMLDRDLAALYEVETRILKRNVRRHIKRFPSDFMFELSYQEFMSLRSQIGISNRGGTRYMPWPSPNRVWRCFPASSTASGQFGTWKANVPEIYIETQYPELTISWLPGTTIWSFTGGAPFLFGFTFYDYISDSVFVICSGVGNRFFISSGRVLTILY